ncbi:hypothetical protein ACIG0C_35010 [Kitasatospora aureofaciens]|uniref:Competence protein n=1 Tax=Kitasatospora aureofaciens TaxID=1894 RepID=A0A8H9LYB6_KITAU|nr:hypothetical protein [Kitasatospora aureofaciens]GGV07080.1 hypothetical protein GCM10010502_72760 [Kitasatospora aureofaciens]
MKLGVPLPGDRRRIQTAVLGSADSDDPLVLPIEAIELDAFRRRHAEDTFWCGLLLGGCGAQLTTKLYRDRACHFAHHPDPDGSAPVCRRSARGVESADHLYLKRDLSGWLGGQGMPVVASFPHEHGVDPGSVVELALGTGGRLRAYLKGVSPDWTEPGHILLGPEVEADFVAVAPCRYVNRFKYVSEGVDRRIAVGTQTMANGTQWFGLDECRMTPDGLLTPLVDQLLAERTVLLRQAAAITVTRPVAAEVSGTARAGLRDTREGEEFTRRLAAGMRAGEIRLVQALVEKAPRLLERLAEEQGLRVRESLAEAATWLKTRRSQRSTAFAELSSVLNTGDFTLLASALRKASAYAVVELGPAETRLLARARAVRAQLASQPHREGPGRPRHQQRSRAARQRAAAEEVHQILRRLAADGSRMRPVRLRAAVTRLAAAAALAEQALEPVARREVQDWLSHSRRSAAESVPRQRSRRPVSVTGRSGSAAAESAAVMGPAAGEGLALSGPARLGDEALGLVAAAVRGALKKAARERCSTSWGRLHRQLDRALPVLHPDDRVEVLVRVEAGTAADEPLLSSLLAVGDSSSALYRRLARRLGRTFPADSGAARTHWQSEVLRLHQLFRYR